jgi:hypothetical protein
MSFFRIKTVNKNGKSYKYLYRQTSVREGPKVRSIMEYFGSFNGKETYGPTRMRNQDLQSTRNPRRPDFDDEYMRHLFKTDREAFNRLHAQKYARQEDARQSKKAWAEKHASRSDKQERAQAKQAADAKWKESIEAVKEFNEAREAEKSDTTGEGEPGKTT